MGKSLSFGGRPVKRGLLGLIYSFFDQPLLGSKLTHYQSVIEIDFVQLIQNSLSVAKAHRDRLFRTRLSIESPLSNNLRRQTKMPVYGRRAHSTPRPAVSVRQRLDITRTKGFQFELDLLQEFQNLYHYLLTAKGISYTQVPKLMLALSKFPVVSITILANEAQVSRRTAKRWLIALEQNGNLKTRDFNGMKQYAYSSVLEILDRIVRYSATP